MNSSQDARLQTKNEPSAARSGPAPAHRGTIELEQAQIVSVRRHDGAQITMTLHSPQVAMLARPGQFVHLQTHELLAMRRPMSLLSADPDSGHVSVLFKTLGQGTRLLSERQQGEWLSVLGPIGNGFSFTERHRRPLLVGGGVGIPPMAFMAERLARKHPLHKPFVIMGSEIPFPFQPIRAARTLPALPAEASHAMPAMESLGIDSRLASQQGFKGCFQGYVTELARAWLQGLSSLEREEVLLQACGPGPMLSACAALAAEFAVACEVCLEEYMACGVGGCAGCVVRTRVGDAHSMQRVCVDGPVFDSRHIVWD